MVYKLPLSSLHDIVVACRRLRNGFCIRTLIRTCYLESNNKIGPRSSKWWPRYILWETASRGHASCSDVMDMMSRYRCVMLLPHSRIRVLLYSKVGRSMRLAFKQSMPSRHE